MSRLTMSFVDHNRESSATSINVVQLSGSYASWREGLEGMENAIAAVTLGLLTKRTYVADIDVLASPVAASANPNSQRERKWLVRGYDSVTFKPLQFEIPNADLSLLQPNSEFMNISSGPGFNLVGELEIRMRSSDGNPVVITSVQHVGRNI